MVGNVKPPDATVTTRASGNVHAKPGPPHQDKGVLARGHPIYIYIAYIYQYPQKINNAELHQIGNGLF